MLRVWLDGVLVIDRADLNYLPADQSFHWSTVHVSPTFGGQGGSISPTFNLFFDEFYVSGSP